MGWYLLIFVVVGGIGLFLMYHKRHKLTNAASLYEKKSVSFTPFDTSFIGALDKGIGAHGLVFRKVRAADILEPKKELSRKKHQAALNRINGKYFDYVICNSKDLSVKCVIELKEASPQTKKNNRYDAFLQEVCNQVDLPILSVATNPGSQMQEIRKLISRYIPKAPTPLLPNLSISDPQLPSEKTKATIKAKHCPKCGSELVARTIKKGEHAGKKILVCSSYPECRYYEAIKPVKKAKHCPKCGSELVVRTIKKGEHAGKKILICNSYPECRYYEPMTA